MRAVTCVARYAQRWGAHIVAVPIAPWQGFTNTRRGIIQDRQKREGSEAGASCEDKFSNVEKKSLLFFLSPESVVTSMVGMSIVIEERLACCG